MADDKSKTAADRPHVNVHEGYELRYWKRRFGVTKERLEAAVRKVGTRVEDVSRELDE